MTIPLGQVMPGHPQQMREAASNLWSVGIVLQEQSELVHHLGMSGWHSGAAAAFARRMQPLGQVLEAAQRRYFVASHALTQYADALARLQATQRSLLAQAEAADARAAEHTAGQQPPGADARRGAFPLGGAVDWAARVQLQAQWNRAVAEFGAVDEQCAAALRQAADDEIADSLIYKTVHFLDDAGQWAATLGAFGLIPSPLSPALLAIGAIGAGVSLVSKIIEKGVYHEGEWSDIGLAAGVALLGGAGKALKFAGTTVKLAEDGKTVLAMTAQQRLLAGLNDRVVTNSGLNVVRVVRETKAAIAQRAAKKALGAPSDWQTFVAQGPAGATVSAWTAYAATALARRARDKAITTLATDYVAPWMKAGVNGNDAKVFVKTSLWIKGVLTVKSTGEKIASVPERIDKAKQLGEEVFGHDPRQDKAEQRGPAPSAAPELSRAG